MEILDKYIGKQVVLTILLVAFMLLGFDLFFSLVNELKMVGRGDYTLGVALIFLILSIPGRLYSMFPWAALIGTLICMGALANHSELVVMRTSAISIFRITCSVLKAALILILGIVLVGEGIAPIAERFAQNKKTAAISGGQTVQTPLGLWVRHGQEFIHVQTVRNDGKLLGVTRYQFDKNRQLMEALYAESAEQEDGRWRLTDVKSTRFSDKKTQAFQEKTKFLPQLLEPEILETAMIKHPERLSLFALWRTIQHRVKNELNTENYQLAFWSKIFQPVVILMMVFLAVPFVFGPLRSVSTGFRIVVGILTAFLFHTVNHLFAPLAVVYQVPAIIAVLTPIMVFGGFGFWMLKRRQ